VPNFEEREKAMNSKRGSKSSLAWVVGLSWGVACQVVCAANLDSLVSEALGSSAGQAGPNPKMVAVFQTAVDSSEKDPRSYRTALAAGRAAFYLEKDSLARRFLDRAISLAPDSVGGRYYSGALYRFADEPVKAIQEFERAFLADRSWIVALREKAEVQVNSGREEEGLATARRILTIDSANLDGLYLVGRLLAAKGDAHAAIPYFAKTVAIDSGYKDVLYNYGQSLQLDGDARQAEAVFRSVHARQKLDWKILAKLVQVSYAQGRDSAANAYASELHALRRGGKVPELRKERLFVREQFKVGRRKVFALEYFDLVGDRAVRYSFNVKDTAGKDVEFKVTLGSYAETNEMARSLGEIKKGERLFHLDAYTAQGQSLLAFYKGEPKYEVVREDARKYIADPEGSRKTRP